MKNLKYAEKKYKQETGKDPYNWEDGAIVGKTNEYVNWLEEVVKNCSIPDVVGRSEQLVCDCGNKLTDKEIYFGQCLQCDKNIEEAN